MRSYPLPGGPSSAPTASGGSTIAAVAGALGILQALFIGSTVLRLDDGHARWFVGAAAIVMIACSIGAIRRNRTCCAILAAFGPLIVIGLLKMHDGRPGPDDGPDLGGAFELLLYLAFGSILGLSILITSVIAAVVNRPPTAARY
jgi:hypothetical protein